MDKILEFLKKSIALKSSDPDTYYKLVKFVLILGFIAGVFSTLWIESVIYLITI